MIRVKHIYLTIVNTVYFQLFFVLAAVRNMHTIDLKWDIIYQLLKPTRITNNALLQLDRGQNKRANVLEGFFV